MNTIRAYYYLTKPGIIKGNLLTLLAGYLLAIEGEFDLPLLIGAALGTVGIIGSASVFNNILDRNIDKKMKRTKNRAIPKGTISVLHSMLFGSVLLVSGFAVLIAAVNTLTAIIGIFGFFMYVLVYGYAKRRSDLGTLVGAVPGAIPPVAGYTAVTNQIDAMALVLFVILVFWQMTHFYAIAIFRKDDYRRAGIPVLPITQGEAATRRHMYVYTGLFVISSALPYFMGYAGEGFLVIVMMASLYWLYAMIKANSLPYEQWAKSVFRVSLFVLLGFCLASLVDYVLI